MTSVFKPDVLNGKVALITGGGTGIGLGIAKCFVAHGAKVVVSGRREQPLIDFVNSVGAEKGAYIVGDVKDFSSCEQMVAKAVQSFGRLDILVNNAAGNFATAAEDFSPNAFKTVIDIDLHGSFSMAKAALLELKKTKGVIISISATLYYRALPFQLHASAAKAAIDVMTNSLGVEWGTEHGIRSISIAPGPIENTVGGPTGRVFGGSFNVSDIRDIVPIGRYGTVDDIANCALFVASPAGSYINATSIVVDGGQWHGSSAGFLQARELVRRKSSTEKKAKGSGSERSKL